MMLKKNRYNKLNESLIIRNIIKYVKQGKALKVKNKLGILQLTFLLRNPFGEKLSALQIVSKVTNNRLLKLVMTLLINFLIITSFRTIRRRMILKIKFKLLFNKYNNIKKPKSFQI